MSPLGQRLYVKTQERDVAVATPTTLGVDPLRTRSPENEEQTIHPLYGYIYVTDREEGLVLVGVATLLDGNPANNFLDARRHVQSGRRPERRRHITIAGHYAYVLTPRGLVVVDLDDPLAADGDRPSSARRISTTRAASRSSSATRSSSTRRA